IPLLIATTPITPTSFLVSLPLLVSAPFLSPIPFPSTGPLLIPVSVTAISGAPRFRTCTRNREPVRRVRRLARVLRPLRQRQQSLGHAVSKRGALVDFAAILVHHGSR